MKKHRKNIDLKHKLAVLILLSVFPVFTLFGARIKDVAKIEGVSGTQVIGYGLITGLNNTGDNQRSTFTVQSVSNMLKRFGITVPQTNPRIRNAAAVMVTATIPTFMRRGSKIDVQVSSIGDATSLQGGILLMTPLSRSDGSYVGMAQGGVSVGGYNYQSAGSRIGRNFVTTGRVPSGLILEENIEGTFVDNQQIRIVLHDPDFTTSVNLANAINALPGLANAASAIDAATVQVQLPGGQDVQQAIQTIAQIEQEQVQVDPAARVVINERTGTVVVGGNVQLLPSVVAHGGLEISIQKRNVYPPPNQLIVYSRGLPAIAPNMPNSSYYGYQYQNEADEEAELRATEEMNEAIALEQQGATVQDIANALNELKVSPRDLIAIFQALKEAGALQGELIIQ